MNATPGPFPTFNSEAHSRGDFGMIFTDKREMGHGGGISRPKILPWDGSGARASAGGEGGRVWLWARPATGVYSPHKNSFLRCSRSGLTTTAFFPEAGMSQCFVRTECVASMPWPWCVRTGCQKYPRAERVREQLQHPSGGTTAKLTALVKCKHACEPYIDTTTIPGPRFDHISTRGKPGCR